MVQKLFCDFCDVEIKIGEKHRTAEVRLHKSGGVTLDICATCFQDFTLAKAGQALLNHMKQKGVPNPPKHVSLHAMRFIFEPHWLDRSIDEQEA